MGGGGGRPRCGNATHTDHIALTTLGLCLFFVTASRMTGAEISDVKLMYAVIQYLLKM